MENRSSTTEIAPDLFGANPVRLPRGKVLRREEPPELKAARALSAQMPHKRNRREKQQVAHLICLNLISLLRHGARHEAR